MSNAAPATTITATKFDVQVLREQSDGSFAWSDWMVKLTEDGARAVRDNIMGDILDGEAWTLNNDRAHENAGCVTNVRAVTLAVMD